MIALHLGLSHYLAFATYAVFIVASLLSLAWRPIIGLYFLILTIPQERLRSQLFDLPLGEHVLVFLLLAVILGAFLRGQFPKRSKLNKILVLFCVFTFFSLVAGTFNLGSDTLLDRVRTWKDYMALPLLFVASSAVIQTRKQFVTATALICFSVLLVNRSVALEIREHDTTHFSEQKREAGPLGNSGSNGVAAFESQMAIFFIALATFEKKTSRKVGLYALTAINIFCLLYSFSRGGYLAFLAALVAYALIRQRKLIPILLVFILGWQFFVPQSVVERVTMTEDDNGKLEESAALRVELWKDALQLIQSNPILGTGYDTYEFMGRVGSFRDTHNFYLKTTVETGIIGLAVFLTILVSFWRMGWSLFRRAAQDRLFRGVGLGMATCTVSIAVANFFGDRWTYMGINGLVWVLLGLIALAHSELDKAPQIGIADESTSDAEVISEPICWTYRQMQLS